MGPGAAIEPFDPYVNTSRRAVGETRRRVPSAPDLETGTNEGSHAIARKRVFQSRTTWSCISMFVLFNIVIFLSARHIRSHVSVTDDESIGGSANRFADPFASDAKTPTQTHTAKVVPKLWGSAALSSDDGSDEAPPTRSLDTVRRMNELSRRVKELDATVRTMKRQGAVMETDPDAITLTTALQNATRELLPMLYGPEPYRLELELRFPPSMPGPGESGTVVIEMAPAALMPHAVYQFMKMASAWRGGAFHRNAGHVLQAMVDGKFSGLAWQVRRAGP
mmetsp:Transcript_35519/g.77552  ORF Transcript_35519/g.77552 Transcript_35519/m.77552 type:complete len:279 (+) Transcript_35519:148-984(+)